MSDLDEHLDEAFASLDDLTVRELHATSEALERRKDGLGDFASIFRNVRRRPRGRLGHGSSRYHLEQSVRRAAEKLTEQIANAAAAFWRHVREVARAKQAAFEEEDPSPLTRAAERPGGGYPPLCGGLTC
jgi:hypothetical protein